MPERWYKEAVVYCLDVDTFADSDGDGVGDLRGLIGRLDYLARLGVTCLWLNPIHPSPNRDDGYDVTDFYGVDPRFGTLGDFAELPTRRDNRGIRVIIDLVVNHTSDQHPWFQSARQLAGLAVPRLVRLVPDEPADRHQGMVFPGEQHETWTLRPDGQGLVLPPLLRVPAGPELRQPDGPRRDQEDHVVLAPARRLGLPDRRRAVHHRAATRAPRTGPRTSSSSPSCARTPQWRRGDAVLLAEANVEPDQLPEYFGASGRPGDRLHMLFDFMLNGRLMLALARRDAEPIIDGARGTRRRCRPVAQWATFLRNHDEIDLSRLTDRTARRGVRGVRPGGADAALRPGHPPPAARRCSATTGAGSSWRTRCSSRCAARRCCATARRSGWARTCRCRGGRRSVPRCSGRPAERRASPRRRRDVLPSAAGASARAGNVREQQRDPDSLLPWFERMIRRCGRPGGRHGHVHAHRSRCRRGCSRTGRTGRGLDALPAQPGGRRPSSGPRRQLCGGGAPERRVRGRGLVRPAGRAARRAFELRPWGYRWPAAAPRPASA